MSSTVIALLISLFFVVILVGGFLVGFWRGYKRSLVNTAACLIAVLVAFFLTPTISKAILNIKAPSGKGTLGSMISDGIMSIEGVDKIMNSNPNIKTIINQLPLVIVNTVMFLLVTLVLEFIAYIVYKIVCVAFRGKQKTGRWVGGAIGVVKAFIVTILAFMPLAGLVGLANNMTKSEDYSIKTTANVQVVKDKGVFDDILPSQAKTILRGVENSFLIKSCGVFGLDNAMFNYYGTIDLDGDKLVISKEINNYYSVADLAVQLSNRGFENIDYSKLNYRKIQKLVNNITDSAFFNKIFSVTASDMIINYKNYSFINISGDVEDVVKDIGKHLSTYSNKGDYFKNDIKVLFDTCKTLGKQGFINDMIANSDKSLEEICKVALNDNNLPTLEYGVENLFSLNLLRDGIPTIAKIALEKVELEIDKEIHPGTDEFTDDEWTEVSKSFSRIVKSVGTLLNNNSLDVIKDPALLFKDENYDLENTISTLGELVDEVRSNKLLQNSEGKPIIDKYIDSKGLALPKGEMTKNDGSKVKIENYSELFDFVSPSLTSIKHKGVFDIIDEGVNVIERLADLISQDGNENLLSEVLLPLYQVDFVKTNIFDKLENYVDTDLIDFKLLTNYQEWKDDLEHISKVLISLNKTTIDDTTALKLVLNGDYTKIVNNLNENQVDDIFGEILYAKSTKKLKKNIFNTLETEIHKFNNISADLNYDENDDTIFTEAGANNQTQEICDIIKKYIAFNNSYDENELRDNDLTVLGALLDSMKVNAKREKGLFKNVFEKMAEEIKTEYNDELSKLDKIEQQVEQYPDVKNLKEGHYSEIDFTSLFTQLQEVESLIGALPNGI